MTVYYEQNDDLDRCVLMQNFGFLIPPPKGWDADTSPSFYKKKRYLGKILRHWGITHDYFPPPGKVVGLNQYKEGYAVADRYDVGEFDQQDGIRTKYGYKDELTDALAGNHFYGVNNMVDLVPNQMFMANQRIVSAYISDANGGGDGNANFLYPAYINTGDPNGVGGQGQHKYGFLKELGGWQVNGGNPHSVGMYSVLSDGYLPYVWNKPGININVAYEGNIPSWFVDWTTKKNNPDGTYSVISTNGEIQYTYNPNILNGYHWGYNLHGGGQTTCTVEYMNGSYVPPWFLKQVLFWGLNGWTYYSQTIPDIYGVNNYLTMLCGFVQYVHFMPYAYWYTDPNPKAQTISFKDYIGNRGFQTEDSFINNVGSDIGGMMSTWVSQQPGYNGTTDDFGNFTIKKSLIVSYWWWWSTKYLNIYTSYNANNSNVDLTKIYPRGNDISCTSPLNNYGTLESIFSVPTDPNGEYWNDLYGMFGETQEDVVTGMIEQWEAYQAPNNIWDIPTWEKYPAYNNYISTAKANGFTEFGNFTEAGQNLMSGADYLLGTDMDNGNSLLQQDTINWENFYFDLGFDAFRIDAPMCFNYDILIQASENMLSKFGLENMRSGKNLIVNESYSTKDSTWQANNGFPQLTMDYMSMSNWGPLVSAQGYVQDPLTNILTEVTYSSTSRTGNNSYECFPNWSFMCNHDTRKGQIEMPWGSERMPTGKDLFADAGTWQLASLMGERFYEDFRRTYKKMTWLNLIPCYATLLSISKTTPCMYWGDIYEETSEYWKNRTAYYGHLTTILTARGRYAFGDYELQTFTTSAYNVPGHNLFANIRKGINRSTGWAVVVGNDPNTETNISINMGLLHANQKFRNIMRPHSMEETTDENGLLPILTNGERSPYVWGHLSIWVPVSMEEEV